ncbi:8-oxo-dGTP pyrophosphatase MutT (NUDIX family) [Algoriphagus boseongensis]|uniref:GDP-mannose pyrophosphatase n=1 Tax=Algoriphagus boseongensis TaxID=1442587 RepID=A0A4R6TCZ6_9BACT|nr:NUDIX hydrolase [Algoriphagus boseongensis]TDQ19324.1 8-oxo-dGTP pyrophosphatase MutT (NUDIX family) [Algoriphagus boseongensis]
MTENPWKTKAIQKIYENPWITVENHDIINPAGKDGIYGKVHFKNRAMAIIPIDEEGYTWLIGQFRYTLDEYSWEIPMGGGPIELDMLESAKRELKEETGLTAQKWTEILKIHTSNSVTDEVGYVYLAQDLKQGETEFEETEILQIKKLHFSEALEMVMNGEITDSISVAGILKAARIFGF